jgi:hypothetical protein
MYLTEEDIDPSQVIIVQFIARRSLLEYVHKILNFNEDESLEECFAILNLGSYK